MEKSYEWNHDQNIPIEEINFWDLIDMGYFELGLVFDPRMLEMYDSLMNEPF